MTPFPLHLYVITFFIALALGIVFTPLARWMAVRRNIFDHPLSPIKTHQTPVPYLGGLALYLAFVLTLLWVRFHTSFESGTLRSLRGILLGGTIVFILGLVDDIKHRGLHYRTKFFFQIIAALLVTYFGVRIQFIKPDWVAISLSILWIVGVTNSFNLIDIMDGLASGVATTACAAFFFISLPTESVYVNFAALAVMGACLGFIPYNTSSRLRIFMGDSGSLLLGFILSSLALGTNYSDMKSWGLTAPLLILFVPLFDTALVFILRIRKGISPFLGSKDHFPLRLEKLGWKRNLIVLFSMSLTALFSLAAYWITIHTALIAIGLVLILGLFLIFFVRYLLRVSIP